MAPSSASAGPKTLSQGKIVEQLTGKASSSKRRASTKATKALKENAMDYATQESSGGLSLATFASNQAVVENRNSNKNMKTTNVSTRRDVQMPPAFSATTSTYLPVSSATSTLV